MKLTKTIVTTSLALLCGIGLTAYAHQDVNASQYTPPVETRASYSTNYFVNRAKHSKRYFVKNRFYAARITGDNMNSNDLINWRWFEPGQEIGIARVELPFVDGYIIHKKGSNAVYYLPYKFGKAHHWFSRYEPRQAYIGDLKYVLDNSETLMNQFTVTQPPKNLSKHWDANFTSLYANYPLSLNDALFFHVGPRLWLVITDAPGQARQTYALHRSKDGRLNILSKSHPSVNGTYHHVSKQAFYQEMENFYG